jgi:hypothetical protein
MEQLNCWHFVTTAHMGFLFIYSLRSNYKLQLLKTSDCHAMTGFYLCQVLQHEKAIKIFKNESYLFPNSTHHLAWLEKDIRPCKDCCRAGSHQRLKVGLSCNYHPVLVDKMNMPRSSFVTYQQSSEFNALKFSSEESL